MILLRLEVNCIFGLKLEMERWRIGVGLFIVCIGVIFFFVGEIGIGYFFGCEFDFIVCLRKILFLV